MLEPLSLTTERLHLRWLEPTDAEFILKLVNDPEWLRQIGDKSVTDLDSARHYIDAGPLAMYRQRGYGLNHVSLLTDARPIGLCGLLRRDNLPYPDIGFALLADFRRRGYAFEAAEAVLAHGRDRLALARVGAILRPRNEPSRKLLTKLGFAFERPYRMASHGERLDLYLIDL